MWWQLLSFLTYACGRLQKLHSYSSVSTGENCSECLSMWPFRFGPMAPCSAQSLNQVKQLLHRTRFAASSYLLKVCSVVPVQSNLRRQKFRSRRRLQAVVYFSFSKAWPKHTLHSPRLNEKNLSVCSWKLPLAPSFTSPCAHCSSCPQNLRGPKVLHSGDQSLIKVQMQLTQFPLPARMILSE